MAYKKSDHYDPNITDHLKEMFRDILSNVGEDLQREGIVKTPERAAKAMQFLTQGHQHQLNACQHPQQGLPAV